jgi:CHASE3 domain sensor protein
VWVVVGLLVLMGVAAYWGLTRINRQQGEIEELSGRLSAAVSDISYMDRVL